MSGTYINLPGATIHTVRFGPTAADQPDLMAVHGLGGSAYNWMDLARTLDRGILAIDLPGFGFSPPSRRHSPEAFTTVVIELLEHLSRPITLLGNSMGGLVSMQVASRRPDLVERLVLIAPATRPAGRVMPSRLTVPARLLAQSLPGLGPSLTRLLQLKLTPVEQVRMTLELICSDHRSVSVEAVREMTVIAQQRRNYPWAIKAFHQSIQATGLTISARERFDAMTAGIEAPTLLLYGSQDPVVEPAWMAALGAQHPGWRTVIMDGIGHIPMLESPAWTAEIIESWFASQAA